jgi:hypothetical protein
LLPSLNKYFELKWSNCTNRPVTVTLSSGFTLKVVVLMPYTYVIL